MYLSTIQHNTCTLCLEKVKVGPSLPMGDHARSHKCPMAKLTSKLRRWTMVDPGVLGQDPS